jgi:hypothetical protein
MFDVVCACVGVGVAQVALREEMEAALKESVRDLERSMQRQERGVRHDMCMGKGGGYLARLPECAVVLSLGGCCPGGSARLQHLMCMCNPSAALLAADYSLHPYTTSCWWCAK